MDVLPESKCKIREHIFLRPILFLNSGPSLLKRLNILPKELECSNTLNLSAILLHAV
jgi:hypothetical protein